MDERAAREIVFLANCAPAGRQPSPEAERLAARCRAAKVACHDCGELFPAAELDVSCLLCETCYDRAGDENAVADGEMTEAEFEARWSAPTELIARAERLVDGGHIVSILDLAGETIVAALRGAGSWVLVWRGAPARAEEFGAFVDAWARMVSRIAELGYPEEVGRLRCGATFSADRGSIDCGCGWGDLCAVSECRAV